jgi:hypothetical protein
MLSQIEIQFAHHLDVLRQHIRDVLLDVTVPGDNLWLFHTSANCLRKARRALDLIGNAPEFICVPL